MKTHVKCDHASAPHGDSDPVVVCQLPSGGTVTASYYECINQLGGRVVGDIRDPILITADSLFLYELPSGNQAVGTHEQCLRGPRDAG